MKTQLQQIGRWFKGLEPLEKYAMLFTLGCLFAWSFVLLLIKLWS